MMSKSTESDSQNVKTFEDRMVRKLTFGPTSTNGLSDKLRKFQRLSGWDGGVPWSGRCGRHNQIIQSYKSGWFQPYTINLELSIKWNKTKLKYTK